MKSFEQREDKLAELILYIAQKCADDPRFGATKLNKILFFADFLHYAEYGEPITGVEYQKLPHGPAPRRLLPIQQRLKDEGSLGIQPVGLKSGHTQRKPVNLREPNLSIFTGREIAMVDTIIEQLFDHNSEAVSELSHRMVGWQIVEEGDTIPYNTIFVSNPPLSEEEQQRGLEIAIKHGV